MTNTEYEVLSCIAENSTGLCWKNILCKFDSNRIMEINSALKILLKENLIEKTHAVDNPPQCTVRLSDKGRLAFLEYTQANNKNCKGNKPDKWKHRIGKAAGIIAAIAAFIASVVTIIGFFIR